MSANEHRSCECKITECATKRERSSSESTEERKKTDITDKLIKKQKLEVESLCRERCIKGIDSADSLCTISSSGFVKATDTQCACINCPLKNLCKFAKGLINKARYFFSIFVTKKLLL